MWVCMRLSVVITWLDLSLHTHIHTNHMSLTIMKSVHSYNMSGLLSDLWEMQHGLHKTSWTQITICQIDF